MRARIKQQFLALDVKTFLVFLSISNKTSFVRNMVLVRGLSAGGRCYCCCCSLLAAAVAAAAVIVAAVADRN